MARTSKCCTLPSLLTLAILVLFSARSWCMEDTYATAAKATSQSYASGDTGAKEIKRVDGIDYDSFVGLMGRRSAAQPNRHMDHILTALLGQRTRTACPGAKDHVQTRRGQLGQEKLSGGIMLDNVNESLQLLYNQRAKNKIFKHDP